MRKLIPICLGILTIGGLLPLFSIGASGGVDDELQKIVDNAPYPNYGKDRASGSCLLWDGGDGGTISTTYCTDSKNRGNLEYLFGLGKFCVSSIDVRDIQEGKDYWTYTLSYNKKVGGYLKTSEISKLPICS